MMQKWIKLSLVALFGCGFIALILYVFLMKDSIRNAQVEPPLILAAEEPVKRHPEQPGGLVIPDQDKLVFDLLDDKGNIASGSIVPTVDIEDELAATEEVEPAVSETVVTAVSATQAVAVAKPAEPVVEEKIEAPAEPAKVVAAPKEEPTAPAAAASTGGWGVQLGSVRVEADAKAALGKLSNQHAALKGLTGRVQAADVKGKTSYRIQFVGLASKDEAAALCRRLGSAQACLPVAR